MHPPTPMSAYAPVRVGEFTGRACVRADSAPPTCCAIVEVLGMVLATWWGRRAAATIALAVGLAFIFG